MTSGRGTPFPLGVTPDDQGVNVAVWSAHADAIAFCLFDSQGREQSRILLSGRSGEIFHGHLPGVVVGDRYGLRAHGPYAPQEGHRFNPSKLLIDPYALALDRVPKLDRLMFGECHGSMDDGDSGPVMPLGIVTRPGLAETGAEITPMARSVIYELHVRGFTQANPEIPPKIRGTFAGLGHPAAIAYLRALGVTAVEIMPPCAWIEERHLAALNLTNYWGYNPVAYLAPDPRLAPGGWAEVRACVAALAAAGIETLVDMVYNHTGEGDALGPTLSLRGLDNAGYFRLQDDRAQYSNDSGCGNTLALDRPAPLRLVMESLRAWAKWSGVHGFRFDLAPVLGRRPDGFDPKGPLLQAIEQDPLLSRLKMIAEPWDIGPGGYQLGRFPQRWSEWNDRFRDDIRRFWKGEPGRMGAVATRLAGSHDMFAAGRSPASSVNFVAAHDGFTLADLVAYDVRHNAANGEGNRDGTGDNHSWNNGVEGPTDDAGIVARRAADQRVLLASLLLARGTPMLSMGSECGQSQGGNNNAYAQDNATSWLDWTKADPGLLAWTRRLVAIRRDHPGFRGDYFLTGGPVAASGRPDVSWRRADGALLAAQDWDGADCLVVVLADVTAVCLVVNRGGPTETTLPPPADGHVWRLLADSAAPDASERELGDAPLPAGPRCVMALAEVASAAAIRRPVDSQALDLLARAAGVAPEWWETHGTYHRVDDDIRRAVLAGMRLPADTAGEARDRLRQLAERRDHRAVPQALVRRSGERLSVALALAPGCAPSTEWLTIACEDGSLQRIRAGAAEAVVETVTGADGRPARRWLVNLPPLPLGRHRVWRDSTPDTVCGITVAPHACYLPDGLAARPRFGVSAQLYTIRDPRDQGIGDFTTLGRLGQATRAAGGAVLALNPMHAMFAADRGRASPYQPSDRRFLDPIYLDLPEAAGPEASRLAALPAVNYRAVWALKAPLLEQRFQAMRDGAEDPAFQGFVAEGGTALHRFAVFEALAEIHLGVSWHDWPEALRHPGTAAVAAFSHEHAGRVTYHQYLQFLCEQQLARAAAESGLAIGFIRDLAVGCAPDGGEAWASAERMAQKISIGAPPDPFAAEGQVWGLPPPVPHLMAENNYAAFGHLLAANMRQAGGLRIDHALGLARLFWVPDGAAGRDGTYVAYPFDDLLGQIALESHRARALVIGEDLGTVPDGLREVLAAQEILSYRVLLLEREGRGFKPPESYPAAAVACVSTHDLPTFAGWLEGADIDERVALGHRLPADAASDHDERRAEVAALRAQTGGADATLAADAHGLIARTAAHLVYAQADDLAGERQAVNLPGTDQERPNWRRRLGVSVDALCTGPVGAPILAAMRAARPPDAE